MDPTFNHLSNILNPYCGEFLLISTFIDPIRGRMPQKTSNKQKEDTEEMDVEIIESLSPFEKQMAEKIDKMHGTLEDIAKNVSKLTKHLIKNSSSENTAAKEVVSAANTASTDILEEMAGSLKEILSKNSDAITNSQSAQLPKSTQILIEQEVEKIKQSMNQTWSAKLQKRVAEYWQMVRNENTAKAYETWKNNSPVIVPRKLQMSKINGEPLAQTQLREKQVMFNFQSEIE